MSPGKSANAVVIAAALALALAAAGCGAGVRVPAGYSVTPEMEQLLAEHPPPGRLVDAGGFSLHVDSRGSGTPTIVMEAGAGSFSSAWSQVAPELAKDSRVVVYDRAGLGWSTPGPVPRTAAKIVPEFARMLDRAGVQPPYLLVGHSMGAIYMRMYAHEHPGNVVGMVLVDPGDENLPAAAGPEVAAALDRSAETAANYLEQQGRKCATGQLAMNPSALPLDNQMPEEAARQAQALQAAAPWLWNAQADEGRAASTTLAQARSLGIESVGDIPLVVLVSDQLVDLCDDVSLNQEANTAWRELQVRQVLQSPQGELEIARGSGHVIQLDQPGKVVDAVRKVLRMAR